MKIKELIEELKKYDHELEVFAVNVCIFKNNKVVHITCRYYE